MPEQEKFNYKTLDELREAASELNVELQFSEDLTPLARKVQLGPYETPNSLVVHPMEGCDGTRDGSPSELTWRRYRRFARGGAGLLWFEATAVVPEGRANPRQLYIQRSNVNSFKELLEMSLQEAQDSMGAGHRPLCVLQLTHSGRYSKPNGKPEPVIAFHDPYLDNRSGVAPEQAPISDAEIEQLQDKFAEAAVLAREAGFDGVDIKTCHRYLSSELLAGHTREGKYGGSLENRTRFLLETVEKVRSRVGKDFLITLRLNIYDGLPYPYGWGVDKKDCRRADLTEPQHLISQLQQKGVALLNISAGNPYYNPHIGRPYDTPVIGAGAPAEHPLHGVARLFSLVRGIYQAQPGLKVVGTGYSWLRHFFGYAAAANIAGEAVDLVGVGRMAFAYPDFAKDLLTKGAMNPRQACIACSKCSQIMRDGGRTGCVIRDHEIYLPIYREGRTKAAQ